MLRRLREMAHLRRTVANLREELRPRRDPPPAAPPPAAPRSPPPAAVEEPPAPEPPAPEPPAPEPVTPAPEPVTPVIDNESFRARAQGLTLVVDQAECISCGTCVENADTVFVLPDGEDAKAVVVAQDGPMDLVQDAIDACPVTCIHWTDDAERFPQVNDAAGKPLSS